MSTLVLRCVSSERPWEDSVSWTGGCRNYRPRLTGVNITGNVCSKQVQKKNHVFKSWVCFDQNGTSCQYCPKKPSFQSYNTLVNMHSITISGYLLLHYNTTISWCKNWGMASVTPGKPEVHHLVSILCAMALLKAVLHFHFLTHLAKSHALYALILHIPIEWWILSLATIINSCK